MTNIKKNDVKTAMTVTVTDSAGAAINISTATKKTVTFLKRNGTTTVGTASFVTDGSDGKLTYSLVAGDANLAGAYKRQWHVELASGGKWTSDEIEFEVDETI
jgi:hypothetical protein